MHNTILCDDMLFNKKKKEIIFESPIPKAGAAVRSGREEGLRRENEDLYLAEDQVAHEL